MPDVTPYPKTAQLARGERRYRRTVASPKQWQAIIEAKRGPCRVCGNAATNGRLHGLIELAEARQWSTRWKLACLRWRPRAWTAEQECAKRTAERDEWKRSFGGFKTGALARGFFDEIATRCHHAEAENTRLRAALEAIVARYPRGCNVRFGGQSSEYTCLDRKRDAADPTLRYEAEYAERIANDVYTCDACLARAALAGEDTAA